jgi:putative endonuclease
MSQKVHEYWVYMVASNTGTIYVGMTNSLEHRIGQHQAGEKEGFSKTYGCKRLVYWESYDSVLRAIGREKQLKGWRRSKKIALIEKKNPRWQDLSERWSKTLLFPGESMKDADARSERKQRTPARTREFPETA